METAAPLADVPNLARFRSAIRTPPIAIRPTHRNNPLEQRTDVAG